jgi:AAA family ATP:ADP antiporter
MNPLLRKYFDIRVNESHKAVLFFVLMLMISLFYTLGSTVGDALFIAKFGVERLNQILPWSYVGVAIATIVVTWTVDWFLDRGQKLVLFVALEIFFALSVMLLHVGLMVSDADWLYFLLVVWLEVIGLVSITVFFSFMGDFFTSRDARRLYGFINGGFPLGNLLMGFSVEPLLQILDAESLLIMCAVLLLGVAYIPFHIQRTEHTVMERDEQVEQGGEAPIGRVLAHPFVAIIFLMISTNIFYFTFIDFELKMLAVEAYNREELLIFFGQLYGAVGILQMVVQFGLVSLLLRRFGILNSLMINATLALLAIISAIFHPTLAALTIANIISYTFSETLDVPARELLYFPLPGRLRERAQTFANGILAPLAQGVAGVMLLGLLVIFTDGQLVIYIACLFALLWFSSIIILIPRYQAALEESLTNLDFNPENVDRILEQKSSRDILVRLLEEQRFPEIQALLNFVPDHPHIDFREDFYALLQCPDTQTRLKVLDLIEQQPYDIDLSRLQALFDDSDTEVAARAVEVYARLRREDAMEAISPYLEAEAPDLRIAAKAAIGVNGGLDAALTIFPDLKADLSGSLPARIEAVKVITRMNYPAAARVLRPLLDGAELRLKKEVLGSLSRLRDPSIMPDLLPMILIPSLEESVTAALERMPPEASSYIIKFMRETPLDTLHRIRMFRLLGKFPHPDSEAFLINQYQEETKPIQRINCLNALRDLARIDGFQSSKKWAMAEIDWALGNFEETQRAISACRDGDAHFRSLLLDHYHYQLEVLLGLLHLYYGGEGLENAILEFFSTDRSMQANAMELLEVNLDRTFKAVVLPIVTFYLDPPSAGALNLGQLWRKELPADPFLRMIRTYYVFRKTPPGQRKMDESNKNVLGVLSIVSFLKKIELFSEIPANYLIPIAEMMKHKTIFKGETLFEKGDMGDSLYLVQKGTLEITFDNEHTILVNPGETLGDMALIDGESRSNTAKAKTDCRLLQLRAYDFNRLLLTYPIIARSLLRILSKRLRAANMRK